MPPRTLRLHSRIGVSFQFAWSRCCEIQPTRRLGTAPDRVPSRKNSGQTSDRTRASTMEKICAHPHLLRSPHTAATARPPDLRTRKSSPTARSGSGTYMSPSAHRVASNVPSPKCSCSASIRSKRTLAIRLASATRRAAITICSEISVPTTSPLAATRDAALNETRPVPQATSRTRSPGSKPGQFEKCRLRRFELRLPGALVVGSGLVPAVPLHTPLELGIHSYRFTLADQETPDLAVAYT